MKFYHKEELFLIIELMKEHNHIGEGLAETSILMYIARI